MAPGRVATSCSQFVYIFINRVRKTSVSCGTKFCVFLCSQLPLCSREFPPRVPSILGHHPRLRRRAPASRIRQLASERGSTGGHATARSLLLSVWIDGGTVPPRRDGVPTGAVRATAARANAAW